MGANILTRYIERIGKKSPFFAVVCLATPYDFDIITNNLKARNNLIDNILIENSKKNVMSNYKFLKRN